MTNKSLNSIMNEMARAETIASPFGLQRAKMACLTELGAFIILDDTLDALHKQYLDAKAQRKELVSLSGVDDPMVVVAIDMEDSNWCAMQARYIELRHDRKMMDRAQAMIRQKDRDIEEQAEMFIVREKEKKARDFMNYLKILRVIKEKNKTPRVFEWFAVLLIFNINFLGQSYSNKSYNPAMAMAA